MRVVSSHRHVDWFLCNRKSISSWLCRWRIGYSRWCHKTTHSQMLSTIWSRNWKASARRKVLHFLPFPFLDFSLLLSHRFCFISDVSSSSLNAVRTLLPFTALAHFQIPSGALLSWSPNFANLFQYFSDELSGQFVFADLFPMGTPPLSPCRSCHVTYQMFSFQKHSRMVRSFEFRDAIHCHVWGVLHFDSFPIFCFQGRHSSSKEWNGFPKFDWSRKKCFSIRPICILLLTMFFNRTVFWFCTSVRILQR